MAAKGGLELIFSWQWTPSKGVLWNPNLNWNIKLQQCCRKWEKKQENKEKKNTIPNSSQKVGLNHWEDQKQEFDLGFSNKQKEINCKDEFTTDKSLLTQPIGTKYSNACVSGMSYN